MTSTTGKESAAAASYSYVRPVRRFLVLRCATVLLLMLQHAVSAWTNNNNFKKKIGPRSHFGYRSTALNSSNSRSPQPPQPSEASTINRRDGVKRMLSLTFCTSFLVQAQWSIQPAFAYTADSDPLRESLYLMSRVQEATVQQERFVNGASQQDVLKAKMKLTLRLVEKNYRLLDQIVFASEYVIPSEEVVEATTAGYEAAEALQNAIDYVNSDLQKGDFQKGQKEFLTSNLTDCRERLFEFLSYMPKDKLEGAHKRVEEENVANRDEFDGDSDAGVFNPVVLPWKNR